MLVHRCDRCCVYKKEIQPCRTKYRGIWAILMHKIMFPSESCNSVLNGTFCTSRPFAVIAEIFSPRTPRGTQSGSGGTRGENFRDNRKRTGFAECTFWNRIATFRRKHHFVHQNRPNSPVFWA